jgi:hypothetical protein
MAMYHIQSFKSNSGVTTPVFTNIPQNFKHLQLRMSLRDTAGTAVTSGFLRFNSDAAANYWFTGLNGNGSSVTAPSNSSFGGYLPLGTVPGSTALADCYGNLIVDILDYTSSSKIKTTRSISGFDVGTSGQVQYSGGLWNSTAAITSIQCGADTAGNAAFTRIDLYGILDSLTGGQ